MAFNDLKPFTIFAKHSILDVWQDSEYSSGLLKLFCPGSRYMGMLAIISADYSIHSKLRIFPLFWSHTVHGSTTFKQTKV